MTERDWELYRLSVVEQMPEGQYRDAVIAAIRHKLAVLDGPEPPRVTAFPKALSNAPVNKPAD